jgi:hypothetical protein
MGQKKNMTDESQIIELEKVKKDLLWLQYYVSDFHDEPQHLEVLVRRNLTRMVKRLNLKVNVNDLAQFVSPMIGYMDDLSVGVMAQKIVQASLFEEPIELRAPTVVCVDTVFI